MGKVLWAFVKLLMALVVLSVPVMGVWFASSLAAYFNGPIWLMVASGALLFPVLPLLWDGWATRRFGKKVANRAAGREVPTRFLGFWERLIVRTLVVNLALLTGDEIVYVTGVTRDLEGQESGAGHAWNAARVGDKWFLLDPTWGSGSVDESGFVKGYNPVYLFTPPHVLIGTHFPGKEGWQLMDEPLTRGEFLRQPITNAVMYASQARLLDPDRSEITVGNEATLTIDNPRNYAVLATIGRKNSNENTQCEVDRGVKTTVRCRLKEPGTYQVTYYGNEQEFGSYKFWGRIGVNGG